MSYLKTFFPCVHTQKTSKTLITTCNCHEGPYNSNYFFSALYLRCCVNGVKLISFFWRYIHILFTNVLTLEHFSSSLLVFSFFCVCELSLSSCLSLWHTCRSHFGHFAKGDLVFALCVRVVQMFRKTVGRCWNTSITCDSHATISVVRMR